jgi:hypothetical protein
MVAGGKPVIAGVGSEPTLPIIVVAPELVMPALLKTPKVSAVDPSSPCAEADEQSAHSKANPVIEVVRLGFIELSCYFHFAKNKNHKMQIAEHFL